MRRDPGWGLSQGQCFANGILGIRTVPEEFQPQMFSQPMAEDRAPYGRQEQMQALS